MSSPAKARDFLAVAEIVSRWVTDQQLDEEMARLYRLAGEGVRRPTDVEGARAERELGGGE